MKCSDEEWAELSGKRLSIKNKDVKQVGVRGRNSGQHADRKIFMETEGMRKTYQWINKKYKRCC